jgi:hypothetical protein
MNAIRGTRFPSWSKLDKTRDVYGELGWIANFEVKSSKNNGRVHRNFKEFFDAPKSYQAVYNN